MTDSKKTSQTADPVLTSSVSDARQSQGNLAGVGAWCDNQGPAVEEPWLLHEEWAIEIFEESSRPKEGKEGA
ncbi:hypothetical protein PG996_010067 [Apiospora saccharicola]|uniref:Uncharacterized protein n=1 Tax=Apiospora saccharicola TaxID=335842 RepID=A0ABR1UMK1_9PEZI